MRRSERQITSQPEIIRLIRKATICRIALHDEPYPYIVPLNFGLEDGSPLKFYFHCAPEGRKLELIRKNNKVAFELEADTRLISGEKACDWTMHFQSVMGTGAIHLISDPQERIHALDVLMHHYTNGTELEYNLKLLERTLTLYLEVESISAKQNGEFS